MSVTAANGRAIGEAIRQEDAADVRSAGGRDMDSAPASVSSAGHPHPLPLLLLLLSRLCRSSSRRTSPRNVLLLER